MMQLSSLRRAEKATLVFVLLLAVYTTLSNAGKTMSGKTLPWVEKLPATWDLCQTKAMYFMRVMYVYLNDKNSTAGAVPLSTAVILDKNRALTSYNPFKDIMTNTAILGEIHLQSCISLTFEKQACNHGYETRELWSGRQVTYTPDENIPWKSWHGRGDDKRSPLHDLMVLKVKPEFNKTVKFSDLPESQIATAKGGLMHNVNLAQPGDKLQYPLRFAQANIYGETSLLTYEFVASDDVILNCDAYIPRFFGAFLCLRNILELRTLASGAVLVSNQTVFGIGSFAYQREELGILVFTDVRPYYDLIMNAMTDNEFK